MSELAGDLGRYSLGEGLGSPSGYGAAFRALRDDGCRCVVKLLHGFLDPSMRVLDRLLVTLEHLAAVESDHLVPIIDAGVDRTAVGALPWIAMPEVPGARTLRAVVAESSVPPGPVVARQIGIGIARGLADLHAANMLHRDLTPDHVLLDDHGWPWLIAFEVAKIQHPTARISRIAATERTEVYMAPEQLRGEVVPETDLWALGLVLLELLTGRQPVRAAARRRADVRRVIVTQNLVPEGLPDEWHELIDALLRKVPSARPPTARSVVEWLETAGERRLGVRPVRESPRWRWDAKSLDDVDAAEECSGTGLTVGAVDARGKARSNRLRRAARAIPAAVAFEPVLCGTAQLSLEDLAETASSDDDDVERAVFEAVRAQRDADTDAMLLPWKPFDTSNAGEAIEVLRIGLRHRGLAAGKPVILTVQLPSGAVTSRADALEMTSVLCALRPDGWRLLVDGLQPGCGPNVLMATADMASAFASCADVWVRASGLPRWLMATLPGVSVLARSGRGLWTARNSNNSPRHVPERVEVPLLAGPVPRDIADRIVHASPALLACDCPACARSGDALPARGGPTIAHNVTVVDGQFAKLLDLPAALRPAHAARLLRAAVRRRATLPELIDWDGELDDLETVLSVLEGRARTRRAGFRLLRYA